MVLTALGIHGSSVGMYNRYLYGSDYEDPHLLFGEPQAVRSDEWLVVTPYIVSQDQNGYPRINRDIGYGQDMSIVVDVPYEDWSVLFKPQNLAFLFLPLENAFAFKWWFLGYLLMVACYFFVLELLPDHRMFAALLSLALFLSPFVQWWYQPSTLMSLAMVFLALLILVRLLHTKGTLEKTAWALALSYVTTVFILVMYPPFQIACAVAAAFFAIGYLRERIRSVGIHALLSPLRYVGAGLLTAATLGAVFLITRLDAVRTVVDTVYPGKRLAEGGEYGLALLFSTQLLPLIQSSARAASYVANQSEVSNFFTFSPFLVLPSTLLFIVRKRSPRTPDYPLLFVSLGVAVIILRMLIPGLNGIYRLLLLDRVPTPRLLIGLGLLGFLQVILLRRRHVAENRSGSWLAAGVTGSAAFVIFLLTGLMTRSNHPGFVDSQLIIASLALVMALIVFLYAKGWFAWATLVLVVFSFASVWRINPVYSGLDPLLESTLARDLRSAGDEDGTWIVVDDLIFKQYPAQLGMRSLSGVYAYPQLDIWYGLDPQHRQESVYNRYAHVVFSTGVKSFDLVSADYFVVPFDSCSKFVRRNRISHVLSRNPLGQRCLTLTRVVSYPETDFFMYRVDQNRQ